MLDMEQKSICTACTHLSSSPLHATHEANNTSNAENTTNVVNILEDFPNGGSVDDWVVVGEQDQEESGCVE